jgi:hypothetical protein
MAKRKISRGGKRRRGRPAAVRPGNETTQPVAFRLPPSLTARTTAAAVAQGISRNKFVEIVLRRAVGEAPATPASSSPQFDLFG